MFSGKFEFRHLGKKKKRMEPFLVVDFQAFGID